MESLLLIMIILHVYELFLHMLSTFKIYIILAENFCGVQTTIRSHIYVDIFNGGISSLVILQRLHLQIIGQEMA